MVRDNGINYMESLSSIELNNIFNNKYRGNTPLVLYANGGSWDKLSMRERYNYIHNNYDVLANGGTLDDIKRRFAEGGEKEGFFLKLRNKASKALIKAGYGAAVSILDRLPKDKRLDIMYRIMSQGSSNGTKEDRDWSDIIKAIQDSYNEVPISNDRYTGSWRWGKDEKGFIKLEPNTERDLNLLFAKGNVKGLYTEIPSEEIRGVDPHPEAPTYYGSFVPNESFTISTKFEPLLQYLADNNMGAPIWNGTNPKSIELPLSDKEVGESQDRGFTVDNVGNFIPIIGRDKEGNPEMLFYDYNNYGEEYSNLHGSNRIKSAILGMLLDHYGTPVNLRQYVPINVVSPEEVWSLPEDLRESIEQMNEGIMNVAEANNVMTYDPRDNTFSPIREVLPEIEVNGIGNLEHVIDSDELLRNQKDSTILLPEITFSPSGKDSTTFDMFKTIFPDKDLRRRFNQFYNRPRTSYEAYVKGRLGDLDTSDWVSENDAIDNLYTLMDEASWPSIHMPNSRTENFTYPNTRIPRAYYKPLSNSMYNISDPTKLFAELSHALLYNSDNIQDKFDLNTNSIFLSDLSPFGLNDGYHRPGHYEYNAHSLIEPALVDFVFNDKEGDIQNFYDVLKDHIKIKADLSSRFYNAHRRTPSYKDSNFLKKILWDLDFRGFSVDEEGKPIWESTWSNGGKIHIKPENRGKFTALKKRTGHSASWFKAHGTPAQKKMATFALNARKWKHGDGGYLYDGEEEETQRLNSASGFYNYDRDKGIIQLPWNTPLRKRMADRREAEIIDLRLNRPTLTDWIKELPASFISDFTASDDYVPELLKTDRMKYIDHLNSKYNLLGEKRIRYSDAPDAQRERGRRPWTKEVGFDKKFDIGGRLFGEGGLEQNKLSTGSIGFFNHPLLSLKYYGSPLYDLETPFTVAFTDAIIKDKDDFMWNGKMYSTDIDWNKKFEKDANGNIPFQEFANYMYPAVIKILKEKGLPLTNAHNIVRLAGLESLYGTNPVSGKGYNLSGIKWNSKTMGNYNHATNSKDNLEYVDFDNLKDYLEFKIDLLNNRYDAINAENDKDFVDRLHLKSSGINKKGFDYSTNYKGYLNMLLNTKSLDKWLKLLYTPVITRQDNL